MSQKHPELTSAFFLHVTSRNISVQSRRVGLHIRARRGGRDYLDAVEDAGRYCLRCFRVSFSTGQLLRHYSYL